MKHWNSLRPFTPLEQRWLMVLCGAFVVIWAALLGSRLAIPMSETFGDDASYYNAAAIHLAQENFYSIDGVTATMEREPGQSFFLSIIYRAFGMENRLAIFVVQMLLHVLATLFFIRELRQAAPRGASVVTTGFLLLMPSIFHILFSAYRESITLTLGLFFAGLMLSMHARPTWWKSIVLGLLLSGLILTFIPYLFLPAVLVVVILATRLIPRRMLIPVILLPVMAVSLWAYRNSLYTGELTIIGSNRTATTLLRRANQAKTFRLQDPLLCLWVEYISRVRTQASPYCDVDIHSADGGPAVEERILRESKATILQHLPNYLWQSLFYALELHFPFVNGWGLLYNLLEAAVWMLLLIGCITSLRSVWKREYLLFIAIILYTTALSAAIQAVPRYHMGWFFCYAVLAGVGYSKLWTWLRRKKRG
ncbi:hypothetical protein HYZ99_01620 [Candidatus Peregrinibacteria bacterium]|nr:hypothetical protein [Candidatus Peregrinibacteria bacterium]